MGRVLLRRAGGSPVPRYIVGVHGDDGSTEVLGVIDAPDIGAATIAAQPRFRGAGCFPWDDATVTQREQALLKMNGKLEFSIEEVASCR